MLKALVAAAAVTAAAAAVQQPAGADGVAQRLQRLSEAAGAQRHVAARRRLQASASSSRTSSKSPTSSRASTTSRTPSVSASATAALTSSPTPSVSTSPMPEYNLTLNTITDGAVGPSGYAYYSVYVPVTFSRLHLTLMPRYGNPDLLVNVAGGRPTVSAFQYASTTFIGTDMLDVDANSVTVRTACKRVSRPGATCPPIRIAIYGNDYSQFSLLASLDGRTLPLSNGYPLILDGMPNVYTFFTFNASAGQALLPSVSATPSGTGSATGTPSATGTASFNASAAVNGTSPSGSASASQSASRSPFPSVSPRGTPSPRPASAGSEIVFTITALAGMPVMYVSSSAGGSTRPQEGATYCAVYDTATAGRGTTSGSVVGHLTIRPDSACYCGTLPSCVYYVGVGSEFDFTYYTLLAAENRLEPAAPPAAGNATTARPLGSTQLTYLLDGLPQDATIAPRGAQSYLFEFVPATSTAPGSRSVVTLSLSQFYGSVTLYASFVAGGPDSIAAAPAPGVGSGGYQYRAVAVGGSATLTVGVTDPNFLAACGGNASSTRVCVLALTVASSPASGYELTVRTNRGLVLNDGNPTLATVATLPGAVQYFRYTQTDPGDVIISAVPISGAVDVYVGSSAFPGTSAPGPASNASYVWRAVGSSAGRTQAVVVLQDDPRSLACAIPCAYSIAIVPAPASMSGLGGDGDSGADAGASVPTSLAFSVMARTRTTVAVPLLDGSPLIDYVAPYDYDYYVAAIPAEADSLTVSVSLDASGGGGALTGAQSVRLFARVDGRLPDPASYQFASPLLTRAGVDATLTVRRSDALLVAACPPEALVTPGVDANGTAVNVTTLVPRSCPVELLATSDTGAVFQLTSVAGSRVLQDGTAVTGTAPVASALYYTFVAASGASHVQLTLTALAGSPVAYVSSVNPRPNASTAEFRVGSIYGNTLTLSSDACGAAEGGQLCAYYIAVSSLYAGASAVFRLQGSSSTLSGLSLGTPSSGKAGPNGYTYYSLFVPADVAASGGMSLSLAALDGGWMTAFVSSAVDGRSGQTIVPAPNCAAAAGATGANATTSRAACNFLWPANGTYGWVARPQSPYRTSARLAPGDRAWAVGTTYVIAVTAAYHDTDFTITAVVAGQPLTLSAGTPITDFLTPEPGSASFSLYYRVLVPAGVGAITLQGMPVDGDVALFASLTNSTPGPASFDYTSSIFQSHRIDILAAALASCAPDEYTGLCSVFVGVTFPPGQPLPASPVTFSLVSTSTGSATAEPMRLLPGAVQAGAIPLGAWAFYYVNVNVTAGSPWYINHVQLTGAASVFVTTDGSLPSATNFASTASSLLGVTFLAIRPENPRYISSGAAIVGVYALTACSYTLSQGSAAQVEDLAQGYPLQGRLSPGEYSYYSLAVGAAPGDVQLGLTALSGAPLLFVSRWDRPAANLGFRPTKDAYQWAGLGAQAVTLSPADPAFCAGCTYVVAVYCDATVPGSVAPSATAPRCSFLMSGTTGNGALTRLIDGVPVRSRAPPGRPRYFFLGVPAGPVNVTLVASEASGSAQLLVADRYVPSGNNASVGLPRVDVPGSLLASSLLGQPVVRFAQRDSATGANATAALRIYTVGVASAGTGAAVFNLRASAAGSGGWAANPVLLLPGQPATGNTLASGVGATAYFALDVADTSRDAIFSLSLSYGSAMLLVGGSRGAGSTPACMAAPGAPPGGPGALNCTGAMWGMHTSAGGNARLRISARAPCSNALVPASCVPALDFGVATIVLAVVATSPSVAFSLTSFSASGLLLVEDGQPTEVVQAADAETQILLYSINGDPALPDVRFTWDVDASSAAFRWYLTSCVDGACTPGVQYPSPASALASSVLDAGRRVDVVISAKAGSAYAPAYCRANATDAVCNYYLVVVPVPEDCAARRISPCLATLTLTATYQGSLAPVLLDAGALAGKVTVLAGNVVPGRDQLFQMYVSARDGDAAAPTPVVLRLEACDTLLGYPAAFLCEEAGTPGAPPNTTCAQPTRPDYRTRNFGYTLDTRPETVGGDGRSRLALSTRSPVLTMAVANPDIRAVAWERKQKYLPATYEVSVSVGRAVRLRPATNESVGALWTTQNYNASELTIRWLPPLLANVAQDEAWALANASAALNVTYRVFIARGGFQALVSKVTNTSNLFTGVLPSTACGLERWAGLVARNVSVIATSGTSLRVRGLAVGEFYELNVVAVCNDDCLRANAARLGLPLPAAGGLSTLRQPYALVGGVLLVASSPTPRPESPAEDSSLGALGLVAVAAFAVCACFVSGRHRRAAKRVKEDAAASANPLTGIAAAAAAAGGNPNAAVQAANRGGGALAVPRTPSLRIGRDANAAAAAAAAGGASAAGVGMAPEQIEAASYNTYATLAARFGEEPGAAAAGAASSSSRGVGAGGGSAAATAAAAAGFDAAPDAAGGSAEAAWAATGAHEGGGELSGGSGGSSQGGSVACCAASERECDTNAAGVWP